MDGLVLDAVIIIVQVLNGSHQLLHAVNAERRIEMIIRKEFLLSEEDVEKIKTAISTLEMILSLDDRYRSSVLTSFSDALRNKLMSCRNNLYKAIGSTNEISNEGLHQNTNNLYKEVASIREEFDLFKERHKDATAEQE